MTSIITIVVLEKQNDVVKRLTKGDDHSDEYNHNVSDCLRQGRLDRPRRDICSRV